LTFYSSEFHGAQFRIGRYYARLLDHAKRSGIFEIRELMNDIELTRIDVNQKIHVDTGLIHIVHQLTNLKYRSVWHGPGGERNNAQCDWLHGIH